jgi:hypothetical protein
MKQGFVVFDKITNRYKATDAGGKYLEKFWLADMILSCNHWDSRFIFPNPIEQKKPALTVCWLNQSDESETGHSIALLEFRDQKRQSPLLDSFMIDVVDYAVKTQVTSGEILALLAKMQTGEATLEDKALFIDKLKEVWGTLFKGVRRMVTVQDINPKLMLERITAELT